MTKATPKKKTTTTKKKPTVKAHRGFAHVPLRGRGRPLRGFGGDPRRRRRVGDPRRRRPPIQQPIGRPRRSPVISNAMRDLARRQSEAARKRMQQMTPAQRDRLMKQLQAEDRARQQLDKVIFNPRKQLELARPRLPIRRRPTVEQLGDARKKRRTHGDPRPRRPVKRRPHGDPKPKRRVTPTQRSRGRNPNTSGSPRARNPNTGGRIT